MSHPAAKSVALSALLLALGGSAEAQAPVRSDCEITSAMKAEHGPRVAKAVLSCVVAETGVVRDCRVVCEAPEGGTVGDDAVRLSQRFKMRPQTRDGVAIEGKVQIPLVFDSALYAPPAAAR